MLEFVTATQNLPFTVVLGLLTAIFIIEALGFLLGAHLGGLLGELDLPAIDLPDAGVDVPSGLDIGFITSILYWLNIGRIPIIILIVLFMTAFVVTGYALQFLAFSLGGFLLPGYAAAMAATAMAVPLVKACGRTFAGIIPRDETEAVSQSSLVGSRAVIVVGVAKTGYPAQARVCDSFGTTHYLMIEPDNPNDILETGTELLLVRYDGSRYYAIKHPEA